MSHIDVFCIFLRQFNLADVPEAEWLAELLKNDTITLYESIEKAQLEYHKLILRQAIKALDETRIYVIGAEFVVNPKKLDVKYDYLTESPGTKKFLAEYPPMNLYFALDSEWARSMVAYATKQRSSENPFRSLHFTQVPQRFYTTLTDPLNARIFSIDLTSNVCSELEGLYPKLAVVDFVLNNQSTEKMVAIEQSMHHTVKGFQIYSSEYEHMASLLELIPSQNYNQISKIGMNAELLNCLKEEIPRRFAHLNQVVLHYPNDFKDGTFNCVLNTWEKTVEIIIQESLSENLSMFLNSFINLHIFGSKLEYGEAFYELKAIGPADPTMWIF